MVGESGNSPSSDSAGATDFCLLFESGPLVFEG